MSKIPVITTVDELRALRNDYTANNQTVGFVPTMGFLHEGHMALVKQSLANNDRTIVSIFVNPSQFAPNEDLDTYPRDLNHDLELLAETFPERTIDAVFAPTVDQMYPSGFTFDTNAQRGAFVDVLGVSSVLEGRTRPTFFRGVATVLTKLFNVVRPMRAYFGQKDIQQTVVVKTLVRDLLMDLEIVVVPTIRSQTGLALSSRNKYLSNEILDHATCLYRGMEIARQMYTKEKITNVSQLTDTIVREIIGTNADFTIDYIAFSDPTTLAYLNSIDPDKGCILSLAVYVLNAHGSTEKTRLIDNMIFPPISSPSLTLPTL
ncbi:hypothetical protein CANINC_001931 [Pichia inconspicua]|uniref:Pantoate--beta-alanine ligase n=1 Tax=Pichia inconspicua TaxID=52247 RepID=A0A4T0X2E7_9ASCO|nr:hypothetical protein CANINC_001931 [[Candida] inconspicua]